MPTRTKNIEMKSIVPNLEIHLHNFLCESRGFKIGRSSHWGCSRKKVFLKISQNWQEKACDGVSFWIKLRLFFTWCWIFSPNAGKYGPQKTPYLDTFQAVNAWKNKNSETGFFLWDLRNFWEHLVYRTRLNRLYCQKIWLGITNFS